MQAPIWMLIVLALMVEIPLSLCAAALEEVGPDSLRRQAEEGDQEAAAVLRSLHQYTAFLRGIALWRILFLGLAGAAGWGLCIERFPMEEGRTLLCLSRRLLLLVALLLCFYIFTWLLPRRLALNGPLKLLRPLCPVLLPFVTVVRPITGGLAWLVRQLLRLTLHVDPDVEGKAVSEENIRMLMDIGEERGAIETDEKEMIENVFEFNDLTAEDVMVHRTDMELLWVEDTAEEIAETIERSGFSRFPVYEEDADDVIGILNVREWLLNERRSQPKPMRELLRPAYFVPESVHADLLFRDLQSRKTHIAIVVDEYGGTAGLVTLEDLLEEIVGSIYDEFDHQDDQEIVQLGEDQWRIAGSAELEDVEKALHMEFPRSEESETLGGLVFAQLSVIPEDGSHPAVEIYGLRIQVESLVDHRVEWALVRRLPQRQETAAENGIKEKTV